MEKSTKNMSDNRQIPLTHHRCPGRNYSARGIYLITLCTEHRRPLLGELCGDTAAQAHIRPTDLGRAVLRCWYDIPAFHKERAVQKSLRTGQECRREIQIITSQLMPDHFHGIIFIKEDMDISLGQVLCGFMTGCTQAYHRMMEAAYTLPTRKAPGGVKASAYMPTSSPNLRGVKASAYMPTNPVPGGVKASAYMPTSSPNPRGVKASAYMPTNPLPTLSSLWEKGYHDRPLRGPGQLQRMIDYVQDNPRRLWMRKHSGRFFRLHRGVRVGAHVFDAKGELGILQRPMHAVHVRRRFSEAERRAYMNGCILAARQGKALVGAFISEYEQQVRTVALAEGHPVIQLTTDVLTECYKPSGVLFDACSKGQLLLLSQQEGECGFSRRITRAECNALNTLAEGIARG